MWDIFGTGATEGWQGYLVLWLRVAFGAHALLSGINYFFPLVPPPAIDVSPAAPFIHEMTQIGLYSGIKIVEILMGLCLLTNLWVPLALVLEMPTTVSIFYLNTFIDGAPRQLYTGPRELFYNCFLLAAYAGYLLPIVTMRARLSPIWRKQRHPPQGNGGGRITIQHSDPGLHP